ncbi:RRXRR domain-containing protein [Phormidium pseudopriestleyi FRX01]|uniref:RRXRR domain-containing protein n=1 Tax=Phormidium pseudopriestleyi FRX01 TaxID=1759528 RepID=A0ABS3FPD7_9CYAN|nr:RRXRR domain-containing protein [Phormidium pseudopriestleyi FRX01]
MFCWLAPSIQHKFDAHLAVIERIKTRLPVTSLVIEGIPKNKLSKFRN